MLVSGFDLINHCGTDPVADKLLSNVLHYMATDKKHEPYVAVTDSIVWGDYAENLLIPTHLELLSYGGSFFCVD